MTPRELQEKVWELIDHHSMELSKTDWLEFLQNLSADAEIRAEATEQELETEGGEDEDE